jgi:glutaredoxin
MYTLYTRDGCGYCEQIKQVLSGIGESYTEMKLNSQYTREQFVEQFGPGATFPRVLKDGALLGGCSETIVYLRNQGLV